jgi:leader peptidase (prepilin peptidase) / N-methyltransferase
MIAAPPLWLVLVPAALAAGAVGHRLLRHFAPASQARERWLLMLGCTLIALLSLLLLPGLKLVLLSVLLGWLLLLLAAIDLAVFRLPDVLTLPLALAGLAQSGDALTEHAAAGVLGYGLLAGTAWLFHRLKGREGLGLGDAKLVAAGGAWLGLEALPLLLLSSSLLGLGCFAIMVSLKGRAMASRPLPFGLCLAPVIWLLWLALHGAENGLSTVLF